LIIAQNHVSQQYEPLKNVGLFCTSVHSTSPTVKDKSLLNPDKLTLAWLVVTHVGLLDMSDHENSTIDPARGLSVKSFYEPVVATVARSDR
jgi:hypothetical protein